MLVSWAVPKGLPVGEGERHLAVQTEDHPMEYGSFEGDIPRATTAPARCASGTSGTYDLLEWTDKKVSVRLHGDGTRRVPPGEDARRRTGWCSWQAPPKRSGRPGAGVLAPMLAEGGDKPFDRAGWRFEPKLDGIRTLLSFDRQNVSLVSRTGRDMTTLVPGARGICCGGSWR